MKVIYLHGFASGPRSSKAVAVKERLDREGIECLVPDLNVPDFEHLRPTRAVELVASLIDDDCVLVGSSLGALIALHAAARSDRVRELVLLAPALMADERWVKMLGPRELERWKTEGSRPFFNFVTNTERPIDYGFFEDLMRLARPPAPRVPVRMIHGKHDATVPVAFSEEFTRAHPGTELTVVDDDHSLLKHVELVNDAVLEAVRRRSQR
ncbi:MAG TPA: YqiA/YcfP family alpha/beta fold hydrolase [Planctomycetota bacterium]|nr:YqiA/YcfP family alpha/beta fold hydrolase [Planctomycetota bacterium]